MNPIFDRLYATLGNSVRWMVYATLGFLFGGIGFAILGLRRPAEGLGDVARLVGGLTVVLLLLFLLVTLIAALVRWIDRRAAAHRP